MVKGPTFLSLADLKNSNQLTFQVAVEVTKLVWLQLTSQSTFLIRAANQNIAKQLLNKSSVF